MEELLKLTGNLEGLAISTEPLITYASGPWKELLYLTGEPDGLPISGESSSSPA